MKRAARWTLLCVVGLVLLLLPACAPAATSEVLKPTSSGAPLPTPAAEATQAAPQTEAPQPAATAAPSIVPTPIFEKRIVELEWPSEMRLGDSDVLRLSLIPSVDGYTARAEFDEHPISTQEVPVRRPPGYTLSGVAHLDGIGFSISPSGDQTRLVPPGEPATWRWTIAPRASGQQRLAVSLLLRWQPDPGISGPVRESLAFDRGLDVQVRALLGFTRPQTFAFGLIGMLFGGGTSLFAFIWKRPRPALRRLTPNPALTLEKAPNMTLTGEETRLFQALFARYNRLVLESEFLSGYSGARTFLARPVLPDGRSDAATIVKIGPRSSVQREFENYETFVKDRLPPITARIQHAPVSAGGERAALQYTCIAEPGRLPVSLRQALLKNPDPDLIRKLFDTFGPHWWMQRQPYTFRVGLEYDCLLPPHLVVKPISTVDRTAELLDRSTVPTHLPLPGATVRLGSFAANELRADGTSWTLTADPIPGQPPLRVRWLANHAPAAGAAGIVTARRMDLLREYIAAFDPAGLTDPLERLEGWLQESLTATRSTIHGDLNLENVLVGPGNLVWMIDFAQTREGHPLFDFSHLASELVAHVLALQAGSAEAYLARLQTVGWPLLDVVEEVAQRCLFDPARPREYRLSLVLACLGALKYANLTPLARSCLYLTAAFSAQSL